MPDVTYRLEKIRKAAEVARFVLRANLDGGIDVQTNDRPDGIFIAWDGGGAAGTEEQIIEALADATGSIARLKEISQKRGLLEREDAD